MIPGKIDIEGNGFRKWIVRRLDRKMLLLCFIRVVEIIGGGRSAWGMPAWKVFDNYAGKGLASKRGKKYLGVSE